MSLLSTKPFPTWYAVGINDDASGESNDQARMSRPRPSHGRQGGGRGDPNILGQAQAAQNMSMYPDEDDEDDDDENVSATAALF